MFFSPDQSPTQAIAGTHMFDALLILNAGSSSLKFSVFRDSDPPELLLHGQLESLFTTPRFIARDAHDNIIGQRAWPTGASLGHQAAIEYLFNWGQHGGFREFRLVAAGHRVVHGGRNLTQPARVDDNVMAELERLVPLAPLHQPHNIAAIRAVTIHAPNLAQVACFDTSFHRSQPAVAQQYGLPHYLTDAGIQRYGFHGLSYEYIASCLGQIDPQAATGRTIVAHLGNGASMCALQRGMSVATTMGFTPIDGLLMGTRCGSIDPGVLLYLLNHDNMDPRVLERLLTYESGLLGVSDISSDMRALLDQEATNPRAAEAIEMFVYRSSREIGSLAAALGGLDALVFTAGIGEHAPSIRARICRSAKWLGLDLNERGNELGGPKISSSSSRVSAWVIPTNEELVIAQQTQRVLKLRLP